MRPLFYILVLLLLSGCEATHALKAPDASFTPAGVALRGTVAVSYEPYDITLPIVRGTVNGQPVQFVLDTGAESTVISVECARRLGLTLREENKQMVDAHNATRRINGIARLDRLQIGDATFEPFDALCMPLPLRPAAGRPVDGLLSRRVFAQLLLTIDYPRRRIELSRGELPAADGKTILQAGVSAIDAIRLPLRAGGQTWWFMVDTGFASRLSIDRNFVRDVSTDVLKDAHQSQGVNSTLKMQVRRINAPIQLGDLSWNYVDCLAYPGSQNMIGSGLLQNFRVTFDQKNRRVQILK